ncbi:MAG: lamin tail domain-containing protein [Planctomycetales bacterium]|nr:lamin tail domain-containing protein [Planctomycetales bacterium]
MPRRSSRINKRRCGIEYLETRTLLDASPVVSEVLNFAKPPTVDELLLAPDTVADDYDYLELWNPSETESIDLSSWTLGGSAQATITAATLAPDSYGVIVANSDAFVGRYGESVTILGVFSTGQLPDEGVNVTLSNATNDVVIDFSISEGGLWQTRNQIAGVGLEPAGESNAALSKPLAWKTAAQINGTPGQPSNATNGIWINEVRAAAGGSIELFNSSESAVDISGWFLSNDGDALEKYSVPAESIVGPGDYFVVTENDVNPTPETPLPQHFSFDVAEPAKLWLTRSDSAGSSVEDIAEFYPMSDGESFGRVDQGLPFAPLVSPTIGEANSEIRTGPIIIHEFSFHPNEPTASDLEIEPSLTREDLEFVELFNRSDAAVDLSDWTLNGDITGTFADGTIIEPHESVLLTSFAFGDSENENRSDAFQNHYALGETALHIVGNYAGSLPDSYGSFQLLRTETITEEGEEPVSTTYLVDFVAYDDLVLAEAAGLGSSAARKGVTVWGLRDDAWDSDEPSPGSVPHSGVVITEVHVTSEGGAVELYNQSDVNVDLSGWFVSDNVGDLQKYQLAEDTILASGEFLVLQESDFNPTPETPLPTHFSLSAAGHAAILLTRYDADVAFVEDATTYYSMPESESFARVSDIAPLAPMSTPSIGTANVDDFRIGPVVIGEVQFHPDEPSAADLEIEPTLTREDLEFVELYNSSPALQDLENWRIEGDMEVTFAAEITLAPEEAGLLLPFDVDAPENATKVAAFEQHYSIVLSELKVLGTFVGSLPDAPSELRLIRRIEQPVEEGEDPVVDFFIEDQILYQPENWPAADGTGNAIARVSIDEVGTTVSAWAEESPTPGTSSLVPRELLPDLMLWDDPLVGVNYLEYFEPHSKTGRLLMRFATGVVNAGEGPLIIEGADVVQGRQQVEQIVQRDDGSLVRGDAGEFVYHPLHGHIHFDGYAIYNLRVVLPNGGVGPLVATSDKVSFCLLDYTAYDLSLPNAPPIPEFGECDVNIQGISVGWLDVYTANLPDQWIDVEGVPPGEYWFETVVDPFNLIRESDESNNTIASRVIIGVPEYEPDHIDASVNPKTSLGVGDKVLEDLSIHEPGDIDTFRWLAADDGVLNVDMEYDEELGPIDLYVATGGKIVGELSVDETGQHVVADVVRGESYRIVVKSLHGYTNPNYRLSIDGPDVAADFLESNDDLETAAYLGTGDKIITDLTIHTPGGSDFYAWSATETGVLHIDVQFNTREGQLNLNAFDIAAAHITEGIVGQSPLVMEFNVEAGHIYLFEVYADEHDFSNGYELHLDFLEVVPDAYEPNDHNFTPVDIGSGPMELTDLNIHVPFNRDFYRWSPTTNGPIDVTLDFDHESVDLDLITWVNGESVYFWTGTEGIESGTIDVTVGKVYFFEVVSKRGATIPNYSLLIQSHETPRVASVEVGGTTWAEGTRTLYFGNEEERQSPSAPWSLVDTIQVGFTQDVTISEADWQLTNGEDVPFESVEFSYAADSKTATWKLPAPVDADTIHLRIADTVTAVGKALDGEWSFESDLPSGDGTPGGDFELTFDVLVGDYNADGIVSVEDLDQVSAGVRENDPFVDANGDGIANKDDRQFMLDLLGIRAGDADLDGLFISTDLIIVFQANEYEDGIPLNSTWSEGDWNGDGQFTSGDFVTAFGGAGYEKGPRAGGLMVVPEPSGTLWFALISCCIVLLKRHR